MLLNPHEETLLICVTQQLHITKVVFNCTVYNNSCEEIEIDYGICHRDAICGRCNSRIHSSKVMKLNKLICHFDSAVSSFSYTPY